MLNVPARFCVSFIGFARCVLRNSEAVNCSFGPMGLGNLRSGYTWFGLGNGSFHSRSIEGVNSPVALSTWVIRYIEVWQLTLPHTVELLVIHRPVRDPCLSDLSKRHDLNSGVFGGANSTAPSSGRVGHRYPAPQQNIITHNFQVKNKFCKISEN